MTSDSIRNLTDGSVVTPLYYADFDPTQSPGVAAVRMSILVRTDVPSLYRKDGDADPQAWVLVSEGSGLRVVQNGVFVGVANILDFTGSAVSATDSGGGVVEVSVTPADGPIVDTYGT